MQELAGKTALVTGAARRLGRAIAVALAEAKVNVAIHYRHSEKEAEHLHSQLTEMGVQTWLIPGNFEADNPVEILRGAVRQAGSLDLLINSASSFMPATINNITFPKLLNDIRINAWAPFELCREFARLAGNGSIVNLLDSRVVGFDRAHAAYILSKKLLLSMTEILAQELAPHITVNAVAPGLILPPEGQTELYLDELAPLVPLQKHGNSGDIAEAVLFLLRSDFISGQVIYVDGGRHLKGGTQ